MTGVSDEAGTVNLVQRIIGGDRNAESEMVTRYHRVLVFTLSKRCRDEMLAEDVAQETWRLVLEKIRAGQLRDPARLPAFILQIGRNQLLMSYRRRQQNSEETELDKLASAVNEPLDAAEQYEEAKLIQQVLAELSKERDRELLLRFYLAEEDKDVICRELGVSSLHFNRILFRARQRFKDLWQHQP